jgi:hypothetical protein
MNPRQEPYEVIPHVRIRAGGRSQERSLPRLTEASVQRSGVSKSEGEDPVNKRIFCFALCSLPFAFASEAQ